MTRGAHGIRTGRGAGVAVFAAFSSIGWLGGCTVGDGDGRGRGARSTCKDCNQNGPWGAPGLPDAYDLRPTFFAGEPIEDIKKDGGRNRIVIRAAELGQEHRGQRRPAVRHRQQLPGGPLRARQVRQPEISTPSAHRPAGQAWPRMRIGPNLPIRVSLALRETCPYATLSAPHATARGRPSTASSPLPPEQWRSWIELSEFGSARSRDPARHFRVDFNERLHRPELPRRPDRRPRGRGEAAARAPARAGAHRHLDGNFDFELERGQGAQTFP